MAKNFEDRKRLADETMQVLAEVKALDAERAAAFNEQKFQFGFVAQTIGVSEINLRNWLTRGQLSLSSDEGRERRTWRLFSLKDCVKCAAAFHLSRAGIPVAVFASVGDRIADLAESLITTARGFSSPYLLMIHNDGEWHVEKYPASSSSLPAVYTVLNVERLVIDTLRAFGLQVFQGTSDQIRDLQQAAADEPTKP